MTDSRETDGKSYAGAAYNALMEEETKESVIIMLLKTFDDMATLRQRVKELEEALLALSRPDGFQSDRPEKEARMDFARRALGTKP